MATKSESVAIGVLQDQMKNVQDDVKDIKKDMRAGFSSLETKMDNLDKKFAAKWVQTIVAGLVAAILLAFIGVIISYFMNPKTTANDPTTSNTTTINTPTGSTSTTSTKDGVPSATAEANATSSPENPNDSESSSSGGLLESVPKLLR